ncbi:MAG: glycosyltransferase 87 family protein [Ktedonobacterales bacterium]
MSRSSLHFFSLRLRSYPLRWLALLVLGAVALLGYWHIRLAGAAVSVRGSAYLLPGLGVALAAALGAWLVLSSGAREDGDAARQGRNHWLELGLIVGIGLVFRAMFLFVPPAISHDAYRYVWDAHLVSHGISPYLYPASDPALAPLRDSVIWPQLNWPNSPTIYPPGAQLLFFLVNIIAPLNITAMQLAMTACDAGVGLVTVLLLRHYRLDLRRLIVYWWNPIPILEFVYSAHVDAAAALWVALALLLALQHWRGARVLAGVALGMAVLTKLYPLLFVVALLRRRDWGFLLGLCATLLLVTLPFFRLGLGSGGFLTTYFSQRFVDEGIIFRLITQIVVNTRWQFALQGMVLALLAGLVLYSRIKWGLGAAAGILALSVAWIVISPHLYPWYVGGLLPLLAMYLRLPPLTAGRAVGRSRATDLSGNMPMLSFAFWLFVLEMPFTYVIFTPGYNANLFLLFFLVPLALASIPVSRRLWSSRRIPDSRPHVAEAPMASAATGPLANAVSSVSIEIEQE